MPITEKITIKREITLSKDRKHKFLLNIEWDSKLPKAVVIMISPSAVSNKVSNDLTTQLVINNLNSLGYGGVYIGNLISDLNNRSMKITDESAPYHKENFDIIVKAANKENIKAIILAWGCIGNTNQLAKNLQDELLTLLNNKKDIMYHISDNRGKKGLHPLTPSIRNRWLLVPVHNKEISSTTDDSINSKETSSTTDDSTYTLVNISDTTENLNNNKGDD